MVETRAWTFWKPDSALTWLYDREKIIHLLCAFQFSIWESWHFILGTYMELSYLLIVVHLRCAFRKHFETEVLSADWTFLVFSISGEFPFKTKILDKTKPRLLKNDFLA